MSANEFESIDVYNCLKTYVIAAVNKYGCIILYSDTLQLNEKNKLFITDKTVSKLNMETNLSYYGTNTNANTNENFLIWVKLSIKSVDQSLSPRKK